MCVCVCVCVCVCERERERDRERESKSVMVKDVHLFGGMKWELLAELGNARVLGRSRFINSVVNMLAIIIINLYCLPLLIRV